MIRIGIECESIEGKNPIWGVGKLVTKLLEEISRRSELEKDHHFILYFKDNVPDFPFLKAPMFEIKQVPVPFFKNRLFPIYYFALLPIRLWFDRPDVMFWPNYMLPIIAFGKSLVLLTEDVYYEAHVGKLSSRYRLAYKIFGWWTAKFATKILAISGTSKKTLIKLYDIKPERIVVNHLGVDLGSSYAPPSSETSDEHSKDSKGLRQKEGSYLLFVGQMFPRRHVKETILAFEKIAPEFLNLKLIIIGPDKYPEPTIEPLIKQVNIKLGSEAIVHKDYVNEKELNRLYSGARALIYVSDREAFGLPPVEAAGYGIPVIIKDNYLGHEIFQDATFFIKNSHSINEIASVTKEALTNLKKRKYCIEKYKEIIPKYSWKQFTARFLQELENI